MRLKIVKFSCKTHNMSVMHQIINIWENHTSLAFRKYGFSITISGYALLDYSKYFQRRNFLRLTSSGPTEVVRRFSSHIWHSENLIFGKLDEFMQLRKEQNLMFYALLLDILFCNMKLELCFSSMLNNESEMPFSSEQLSVQIDPKF